MPEAKRTVTVKQFLDEIPRASTSDLLAMFITGGWVEYISDPEYPELGTSRSPTTLHGAPAKLFVRAAVKVIGALASEIDRRIPVPS